MKSKFLVMVCLLAIFSCSKDKLQQATQNPDPIGNSPEKTSVSVNGEETAAPASIETPIGEVYAGIGVEAKPYRPIERRPRDGKVCDCENCLGICEVRFKFLLGHDELGGSNDSFVDMYLVPMEGGKTTVFILANLSHTESEFGIDNELPIKIGAPIPGFPNAEVLKILPGLYNFVETSGTLLIDGHPRTYYGKVVVNSEVL